MYAPWAYGCTTAPAIYWLDLLLTGVALLWITDLTIRKRSLPDVSRWLVVPSLLLLAQGWWMTLNASAVYDTEYAMFVPVAHRLLAGPGSLDSVNSLAMMWRVSVLLVIACFVADATRRTEWLMQLWAAIVLAGGSIALFGLIEKATGARMIFWAEWPEKEPPSFFATYFYHANAGAYLNLVTPAAVALGWRAIMRPAKAGARALWPTCGLLCVIAVLANTSKAAQFLGLGMLLVGLLFLVRYLLISGARGRLIIFAAAVLFVLAIGWSVGQASHLEKPLERWAKLHEQLPADLRWRAAKLGWASMPEAGWWGFGAATFRDVFPSLRLKHDPQLEGSWRFLHQDYIQTVLEWGWIGALICGFILFGALTVAIVRLRSRVAALWLPRRRMLVAAIALALVATALHALVDFPLQIASIQLYVAIYVGICWGTLRAPAELPAGQGKG